MKHRYPLRLGSCLALMVGLMSSAALAQNAPPQGDPARGQRLYGGCMGCHSLDDNDVGPLHRGVVGRKAGSVPGYSYSAALRASGIIWDPVSLDHWLSNPQQLVPGSKMFYSVADAQSRADIIAYLKTQN